MNNPKKFTLRSQGLPFKEVGSSPAKWGGEWMDSIKDKASELKNKAKETWDNTDFKTPINKALDYTQTAASAAGMIPVVGNVVDLANAGISGARGSYAAATGDTEGVKDHAENAALNLASAVPGAGQVAGAMAIAKDTAKYAGMEGSVSTNLAQLGSEEPEVKKEVKKDTDKKKPVEKKESKTLLAENKKTEKPKKEVKKPVKTEKPKVAAKSKPKSKGSKGKGGKGKKKTLDLGLNLT